MELQITENLEELLPQIKKELGKLEGEARDTLRKAINNAAKKLKPALIEKAQKDYDIHDPGDGTYGKDTPIASNSTFRTARATTQKLVAQLITKSKTKNEASRFNVTPRRVASQKGVAPPKFYSLRVKKDGSLKPLNKDNYKPFLVQFRSGHIALAQRVPNKTSPIKTLTRRLRGKPKEREKIKVLYSPANSTIYGSQEMLQQAQEVWEPILREAVEKAIKKTLKSAEHKTEVKV